MSGYRTSTAIYGGVLALLMGASWLQWTAEPEVELDGKIVLLPGEADDIERIVWTSEGKDEAIIERKSDALGDFLWVTYTRYKPAPKVADDAPADGEAPDAAEDDAPEADAAADAGEGGDGAEAPDGPAEDGAAAPEEEPELIAETQFFKAGEKGEDLFSDLSPMLALRTLEAQADQLETIGLDEITETLEIVRKGRTVKLELGGEVYGTRDRYVRNPSSGEIYLVDDQLLRPLKYARTRLPDRTLWPYERADLTQVTISSATTSLVIEQDNADDKDKARWVPSGDAEIDDEQLQTWMDKAMRLKGSTYAGPDDALDQLQERFSLTLQGEDGAPTTLQVFEDAEGTWWGESQHTRGKVKLLKAQVSSLSEDVGALTGG